MTTSWIGFYMELLRKGAERNMEGSALYSWRSPVGRREAENNKYVVQQSNIFKQTAPVADSRSKYMSDMDNISLTSQTNMDRYIAKERSSGCWRKRNMFKLDTRQNQQRKSTQQHGSTSQNNNKGAQNIQSRRAGYGTSRASNWGTILFNFQHKQNDYLISSTIH